jgi:hypothetical protein
MIIMGCIARNYFGEFMNKFPNDWAQWIRNCCLGIVLVLSGLQITFKGKGLTVLLMAFLPLCIEATSHALIGMGVFGMPIAVSYSMGFALSAVATSVVA